jgi:hypothetical protein
MKRLIIAALAAGVIGILPNPRPADATDKAGRCAIQAVNSCDNDFSDDSPELIAIRGYCYLIRSAICMFFG